MKPNYTKIQNWIHPVTRIVFSIGITFLLFGLVVMILSSLIWAHVIVDREPTYWIASFAIWAIAAAVLWRRQTKMLRTQTHLLFKTIAMNNEDDDAQWHTSVIVAEQNPRLRLDALTKLRNMLYHDMANPDDWVDWPTDEGEDSFPGVILSRLGQYIELDLKYLRPAVAPYSSFLAEAMVGHPLAQKVLDFIVATYTKAIGDDFDMLFNHCYPDLVLLENNTDYIKVQKYLLEIFDGKASEFIQRRLEEIKSDDTVTMYSDEMADLLTIRFYFHDHDLEAAEKQMTAEVLRYLLEGAESANTGQTIVEYLGRCDELGFRYVTVEKKSVLAEKVPEKQFF